MVAVSASVQRQFQAIGLIGFGHFLSHLYQLALVPVIESVRADYGISYLEFGTAIAVYSIATATLQTPMGVLVDRIGGRWILTAGLALNGAAIATVGLASEYWQLLVLMGVAGAGNSVFHPADYALLSAAIERRRHGRAFSLHAFAGTSGFMAAPILMIFLAELWDWRSAIMFVGLVGVALAGVFMLVRAPFGTGEAASADTGGKTDAQRPGWREIATRPMLMFFVFYIVSAAAGSGVSHFMVPAIIKMYGIAPLDAASILSLFFAMIAGGILIGGVVADRSRRHDIILLVTYTITGLCFVVVASSAIPVWFLVTSFVIAGLMRGITNPARDVLVRRAAPPGSIGTVFGFVTTGFSIGQVGAPIIYGSVMDAGAPEMVFVLAAVFTLLAILIVLFSRERGLYAKE